jgi:hypothetical protein
VTGGANNYDAYATIARQYDGLTLLSAYDPATTAAKLKKHK